MDGIDTSSHICLICNQTIIGLMKYVDHFKSHAIPSDGPIVEQKVNVDDINKVLIPDNSDGQGNHIGSRSSQENSCTEHATSATHEAGAYSGEASPLSEFINNPDDFPDPDIDTDALLSPKHCSDFFQSLELKSANEEAPPRPRLKAVQRLSILEDDAHAESLLPITAILSNLDFSSDDDDMLGMGDTDNAMDNDDGWLSDDSRSNSHPPQGHTGGKWKPGEGPKRRQPIAGKWKPGQRPAPACRKGVFRKPPKRVRGKEDGKAFHCTVCNAYFEDRFSYSLHFGQSQHKSFAAAKKLEIDKALFTDGEKRQEESEKTTQSQEMPETTVSAIRPRKADDSCYCTVCNLYFDNSVVFSTHCETKLHQDATVRHGYREYKSSDGTVLRVDVRNETVTEEKKDEWPAAPEEIASDPVCQAVMGLEQPEWHDCGICGKSFRRKYEMARHLLTRMHRARALNHPEAESTQMLDKYNKYMIRLSPFQCGVCQFYFNRQKDFLDHMGSSSHISGCADMLGPIVCVSCKFKTHKHAEMMEHLQLPEHFAQVERKHGICIVRESHTRITCKFCGVKMHSAVRMKRHCERKHSNRLTEVQAAMDVKAVEFRMHFCPLCKKEFRVRSMLQLHFLKVHKNMVLFHCDICNRGFLDQRRLDNHLRTRYHAKRVIAKNISQMPPKTTPAPQKTAPPPSKAVGLAEDQQKKKRGRPKKGEEKKPSKPSAPKEKIPVKPAQEEEKQAEEEGVPPRRSVRKRKKKEFLNEDDWEDKRKKHKLKVEKSKPDKKKSVTKTFGEMKVSDQVFKKQAISGVRGAAAESQTHDLVSAEKGQMSDTAAISSEDQTGTVKPTDDVSTTTEQPLVPLKVPETNHVFTDEENDDVDDDYSDGEIDDDFLPLKEKKLVDEVDEETLAEASKHIFSCTYCEFAATDLFGLRSHYNEKHPNDILTCQPCNQYFLSLKAYKIHCSGRGHQLRLREQTGETKMHKCPVCDKRFLQESCCTLHLETVHRHASCEADLQRIHKGKDLVTQLYGDHVKQIESLSNDTSVSCPECGKFVKKETLVEHLRLHTGERPYTCRFCPKSFAGRLTLRRHISTHLNMPLFICDLCGKEFKRNSHLLKHIRQHDFEKKGEKHTCSVCKAWFYTPEELARHMKRHGERNFKCTWPGCHWTFVLSGELKSHMFTHTGEKKYLCDMCGFGAPTRTRLRRHVKSHEKTRNFNCEYCPYKATCKVHLKRHMRIHINSRPFACPYCNYTCNTHENIRKHILKTQKHKGMKLYPCKLCSDFGCDSSKEFKAHLMTVHEKYLRENAIDSLAVFSGLYKREEDFQKPKEGSAIIQVTKGRFFRSYQNPDAQPAPPKVKKGKKVPKIGEVKVVIVPPSELNLDGDLNPHDQQQQQQQHRTTLSKTPVVASGTAAPITVETPEPWYSGMPQVHAPSSQELQQQQFRPVEANATQATAGNFLPNTYFSCNIPVGGIQSIQSTVNGQLYTGVVENVVVLSDPTQQASNVHG
ncbi:zinc finger protein 91 [Aplysia californica]|uniref:Zinc finger protein 91 n=1 Tax=Aplysia californica TaxID=6500 RepID=A0ABM1W0E8_APLCA|nr:zinc finger protein 91 [Aplysia californica]